jgi:hypothetical protein
MPNLNESDAPDRHVRIRRLKRLLRFVPRRAVFHRYPLVGRFAGAARARAYLWSFKPEQVRPAIYFGCILALWPVMGLQLPLATALALALRANLMVAGGLQFITNPLSAGPIYYATYRIGKTVLEHVGWDAAAPSGEIRPSAEVPDESITIDLSPMQPLPPELHWTTSFGSTVAALVVGGTLCGLVLAVVLDVLYRQGFAFRQRHHR